MLETAGFGTNDLIQRFGKFKYAAVPGIIRNKDFSVFAGADSVFTRVDGAVGLSDCVERVFESVVILRGSCRACLGDKVGQCYTEAGNCHQHCKKRA